MTVAEVEVRYCFEGGALLWHEDLKAAQRDGNADEIQAQGFEHVDFRVPSTAPALVFSVLLPPEADPDVIKAIVRDKDGNELEAESLRVRKLLRKLGPGHYLIRIPYPRKFWYSLAWVSRPNSRLLLSNQPPMRSGELAKSVLPIVESSDDG